MGTWGTGIKDNDTSMEVYESFFNLYNNGAEPDAIKIQLMQDYASDLADYETRFNVLFSLGLCLWEVQALDEALLREIKDIYQAGTVQEVLRQMGADEKFLKDKSRAIAKLIDKLEQPRVKAKRRVKPPVQIEGPFPTGAALAFQFPNGMYGVVILSKSKFYKKYGSMEFIFTDYSEIKKPVVQDVLDAHILAFDWSVDLANQPEEISEPLKGKVAEIRANEFGCTSQVSNELYFDFNRTFFECITVLPTYTEVFYRTTWGGWMQVKDMNSFADFAAKTSEALEHCYHANLKSKFQVSEHNIAQLNQILI